MASTPFLPSLLPSLRPSLPPSLLPSLLPSLPPSLPPSRDPFLPQFLPPRAIASITACFRRHDVTEAELVARHWARGATKEWLLNCAVGDRFTQLDQRNYDQRAVFAYWRGLRRALVEDRVRSLEITETIEYGLKKDRNKERQAHILKIFLDAPTVESICRAKNLSRLWIAERAWLLLTFLFSKVPLPLPRVTEWRHRYKIPDERDSFVPVVPQLSFAEYEVTYAARGFAANLAPGLRQLFCNTWDLFANDQAIIPFPELRELTFQFASLDQKLLTLPTHAQCPRLTHLTLLHTTWPQLLDVLQLQPRFPSLASTTTTTAVSVPVPPTTSSTPLISLYVELALDDDPADDNNCPFGRNRRIFNSWTNIRGKRSTDDANGVWAKKFDKTLRLTLGFPKWSLEFDRLQCMVIASAATTIFASTITILECYHCRTADNILADRFLYDWLLCKMITPPFAVRFQAHICRNCVVDQPDPNNPAISEDEEEDEEDEESEESEESEEEETKKKKCPCVLERIKRADPDERARRRKNRRQKYFGGSPSPSMPIATSKPIIPRKRGPITKKPIPPIPPTPPMSPTKRDTDHAILQAMRAARAEEQERNRLLFEEKSRRVLETGPKTDDVVLGLCHLTNRQQKPSCNRPHRQIHRDEEHNIILCSAGCQWMYHGSCFRRFQHRMGLLLEVGNDCMVPDCDGLIQSITTVDKKTEFKAAVLPCPPPPETSILEVSEPSPPESSPEPVKEEEAAVVQEDVAVIKDPNDDVLLGWTSSLRPDAREYIPVPRILTPLVSTEESIKAAVVKPPQKKKKKVKRGKESKRMHLSLFRDPDLCVTKKIAPSTPPPPLPLHSALHPPLLSPPPFRLPAPPLPVIMSGGDSKREPETATSTKAPTINRLPQVVLSDKATRILVLQYLPLGIPIDQVGLTLSRFGQVTIQSRRLRADAPNKLVIATFASPRQANAALQQQVLRPFQLMFAADPLQLVPDPDAVASNLQRRTCQVFKSTW